jgi:hypothetical protein
VPSDFKAGPGRSLRNLGTLADDPLSLRDGLGREEDIVKYTTPLSAEGG